MKDLLGVLSSSLCVVHCLVLPVAVAAGLPFVGTALLSGEGVHLAFSCLVILLAAWAFPYGWLRHRHALPGVIAMFGIGLLMLTLIATEVLEVYLATLAACSLIAAHLMNRRLLTREKIL